MNTSYKIKLLDEKKPTLTVHPETADLLGIGEKKIIALRFGCIRRFADVVRSGDAARTEIRLSAKLAADLHLPEYPEYEFRVSGNEMNIGPFIGMLMTREDSKLTPAALEKIKIYLSDYGKLHGAIVVFALDKADSAGQLVEGYCFNPESQSFEKGVFPFPAAIYRTVGLNEHWKNCFLTVLGDRFFNNTYFNKWDMYQWYSRNPDFSSKLPFTCVYQSAEDVFDQLEKYGRVFIKPLSGLGGHRITQIQQSGDGCVFQYRENGVNRNNVLGSREEAVEFIERRFSRGKYLIQQPIDLIQIDGGVTDFRCIMQKDQSAAWVCRAIIGRCGDKGSVVSNISSGGTAFCIDSLPVRSLPLPENKAVHLGKDIAAFAYKVCRALDQYGVNCGTLGLDIGVDIHGNLWLIEINNRDPDPTIALDIRDRPLYVKLKTGILFYAKALSGFKEEPLI